MNGGDTTMSIIDLGEGTTETDTPVAVWKDLETNEIIFQYGYTSISMPEEDYAYFVQLLNESLETLNKT